MPLVTVASRPNGEPIATTFSPTSSVSEVLSVATVQAADALGLDDREVGQRVGADDRGLRGALPSLKLTGDLAAVAGHVDDVVVGEDHAVGADDDARPGAGPPCARDVDLHHRRQHRLGDLLDRAVRRRASSRVRGDHRAGRAGARCRRAVGVVDRGEAGRTGHAGDAADQEGAGQEPGDHGALGGPRRRPGSVGCWYGDRTARRRRTAAGRARPAGRCRCRGRSGSLRVVGVLLGHGPQSCGRSESPLSAAWSRLRPASEACRASPGAPGEPGTTQ